MLVSGDIKIPHRLPRKNKKIVARVRLTASGWHSLDGDPWYAEWLNREANIFTCIPNDKLYKNVGYIYDALEYILRRGAEITKGHITNQKFRKPRQPKGRRFRIE
jgi:hypothetical protein